MQRRETMANLTDKELHALEDQLGFEKVMCCKYQDAMGQCTDQELKNSYQKYSAQHCKNYEELLDFLK